MRSALLAALFGLALVGIFSGCRDAEVAASPSATAAAEHSTGIANPFLRAPSAVVEVTPSTLSEALLGETRPDGFKVIGASEAQMNRSIAKVTRADLGFGDCIYEDRTISTIRDGYWAVACKGPWEFFVVGRLELSDGEFASPELVRQVADMCYPLGANDWLAPPRDKWDLGDRAVACVVTRDMLDIPTPGTCYRAIPPLGSLQQLDLVPCWEDHNYEAFTSVPEIREVHSATVPDEAARSCVGTVPEYLGGDPLEAQLQLRVDVFVPEVTRWTYGDRTIRCFLSLQAAPLFRPSLKDSLRRTY